MTPEEATKLKKDNYAPRLQAVIESIDATLKHEFKNGYSYARYSTCNGLLSRDLVKGIISHYTKLGWYVETKFVEGYLEFYTRKPEPLPVKKSWWSKWFS